MAQVNYKNRSKGAALLIILVLVVTIAIVSLGFISRGDKALLCGQNTELKAQMDYLAESGLEQARGLILNPQDVEDEYWKGDTGMQLTPGSDDYYDVSVERTGYCNYEIKSTGYRMRSGKKTAQSSLRAELRLDPCIGLRTGSEWNSETIAKVYSDVYCRDSLSGYASIDGDAYAGGSITAANITGAKIENVPDDSSPVASPDLTSEDFSSSYRIGPNVYPVSEYTSDSMDGITLGPTQDNPAGIYFHDGDLSIYSNVTINGTLAVKGNLRIIGSSNTITAQKNFPAVIIDTALKLYSNSQFTVQGLAFIGDEVKGEGHGGESLTVIGALFIRDYDISNMDFMTDTITVTACADKAALKLWADADSYSKWSPASGAFFTSIERKQ